LDDNYQTYLNRVAKLAMPESYKSQVQHIQSSPKFQILPTGERKAVPFAGYTVIAPPAQEDNQNSDFYQSLNSFQKQLIELTPDNLIVPVPPSSLHITLADLIWESAYHYAQEKIDEFDTQLPSAIAKVFEQYQQSKPASTPIEWQVLSVIVMPRAIGVSLVPKNENAYNQILNLRRAIYQSPDLTALGLEQHYHFTPHITLGYFGEVAQDLDRDRLSDTIGELNQQLSDYPFKIYQAELRKFDDMTHYYREPDWSILTF